MNTLKDITLKTKLQTQIHITSATVEESDFEGSPALLSFNLTISNTDYGKFQLILSKDFHISDTYLDCGKHLPEAEIDEDPFIIEPLQEYAEVIQALYEANRQGTYEIQNRVAYIHTAEDLIEEQKTWHDDDQAKTIDLTTSKFWLTAPPDEIIPVNFDDFEKALEDAEH